MNSMWKKYSKSLHFFEIIIGFSLYYLPNQFFAEIKLCLYELET